MELILDRVTKQYQNKIAVDRISLRMHPGVYGLLGTNGAGKTTLMRLICGILRCDSGTVALDGMDVSSEEYRARLGYLPQDFGYYPEFSGMDFLIFREIYDALSGGADGVYFGFRIVASHRKTNLEAVSGGGMNDRLQFTGQSVNCIFLSVMLY